MKTSKFAVWLFLSPSYPSPCHKAVSLSQLMSIPQPPHLLRGLWFGGMQGVKLDTAEPCWNSQPELSPGCRAVSLSPDLLMPGGGSSVTLSGKRVEHYFHPTPPTSSRV